VRVNRLRHALIGALFIPPCGLGFFAYQSHVNGDMLRRDGLAASAIVFLLLPLSAVWLARRRSLTGDGK
jgi:hypothetical protein